MVDLEQMTDFVTGRARGVALKSNCPSRKACADNFGLDISSLSRYIVKNDWPGRRSNSEMGKSGSNEVNSALKLSKNSGYLFLQNWLCIYVVAPTGNLFGTFSWQFVKYLMSHYPISMFLELLLRNTIFHVGIAMFL